MKKMHLGILAAGVLAACSSSSNNGGGPPPPTPSTYTYTGTPAAANTNQSTAAVDAQSNSQDLITATQGSVSDNADTLSNTPELPDEIVEDVGTSNSIALPRSPAAQAHVIGKLLAATRSGELVTGCYTTSGDTITYNNCNLGGGTTGYTLTITGSLTASPTAMSWSIQATYTFTDNGDSFDEVGTWTGSLAFTGDGNTGTISGKATVGWTVNDNASGSTFNFAYTAQILFNDLAYDNSCDTTYFTSGSLDVSVTVADSDTQFTGGYADFGIQINWNGCGNPVTVITGSTSG